MGCVVHAEVSLYLGRQLLRATVDLEQQFALASVASAADHYGCMKLQVVIHVQIGSRDAQPMLTAVNKAVSSWTECCSTRCKSKQCLPPDSLTASVIFAQAAKSQVMPSGG